MPPLNGLAHHLIKVLDPGEIIVTTNGFRTTQTKVICRGLYPSNFTKVYLWFSPPAIDPLNKKVGDINEGIK